MTIRAVLFDLGDTLFRLGPLPDVTPRIALLLEVAAGLAAPAAKAEATVLLETVQGLRAANTGPRENDLEALFLAALWGRQVSDPAGIARAAAGLVGDADLSRFHAASDIDETLAGFRARGLLLAGVSNTTTHPGLLDGYLVAVGIRSHLDEVVYSSALGYRKPHPAIYHAALESLGVAAAEAIFVGDRVREDVLGPRSAGIRAVLTHEHRQEDPARAAPVEVIRQLGQLHTVLGQWLEPG